MAPKAIRLAWHSAGTYDKADGSGGSEGGHIRFPSVLNTDANLGLDLITDQLEPIYQRFDGLTYADLYMLAGNIAVEVDKGPRVEWCGGRSDEPEETAPPDGLLPPAAHPDDNAAEREFDNIARQCFDEFFDRMGFTEREMVALMAAHSLGRMNNENSGFVGQWDSTPNTLDTEYFEALAGAVNRSEDSNAPFSDYFWRCYTTPEPNSEEQWTFDGAASQPRPSDCTAAVPTDPESAWNMNPFDMALVFYDDYRPITEEYAADQQLMLDEFGPAWHKLVNLGVTCDDSIVIVDNDLIVVFDPLDIFRLGPEGTATMSFILLVVVAVIAAAAMCICLCGLDAKIKLAVHPSGAKQDVANGGYAAMY